MLRNLKKLRGIVQLTGIILSAAISAVAAYTMGGDPVLGGAAGVAVNSTLEMLTG